MLHQRVIALRDEEQDWVEYGFARFVNHNTDSAEALAIEPIMIMAAANYLSRNKTHSTASSALESLTMRGGQGEHFEDSLVVYFSLAFGPKVALSEVFNFGDSIPDWAQIEGVQLVAMCKGTAYETNSSPDDAKGVPISICCDPRTPEETLQWFEDADAVMCLPDIFFGPDIVFFVNIPGRGDVCIIVQARFRNKDRLDKLTQEHANSTLVPSEFYNKKVGFFRSRLNVANIASAFDCCQMVRLPGEDFGLCRAT
jgi:hypothetical protein